MQEKNTNNSSSLGICQRLFNFIINSLIARALKRVTLGQPLPQGYDHSLRPAKSNGELMVHHKDQENSEQDSGFEIQLLFKQSEELESWTSVDPAVSKSEQPELPLVQHKIEPPVEGKSSEVVLEPNFTTEDEEPKRAWRRLRLPLDVAPNIDKESDEYIKSRKEAMSKNMDMEPMKKS